MYCACNGETWDTMPCTTHGVQPSMYFLFGFTTRWLTLYKMISVRSLEITKRWATPRASIYTCYSVIRSTHRYDLVVAYISIHMLLMLGINNVLYFTVHKTNDGVRKIPENPIEHTSNTHNIEVSENLLYLFFFWLESTTEVHLHKSTVLCHSPSVYVCVCECVIHQNRMENTAENKDIKCD